MSPPVAASVASEFALASAAKSAPAALTWAWSPLIRLLGRPAARLEQDDVPAVLALDRADEVAVLQTLGEDRVAEPACPAEPWVNQPSWPPSAPDVVSLLSVLAIASNSLRSAAGSPWSALSLS